MMRVSSVGLSLSLLCLLLSACSAGALSSRTKQEAIGYVKSGNWDLWDNWAGDESLILSDIGVHGNFDYQVYRAPGETNPNVVVVQLNVADASGRKTAQLQWDVNVTTGATTFSAAKIGGIDQKGKSALTVLSELISYLLPGSTTKTKPRPGTSANLSYYDLGEIHGTTSGANPAPFAFDIQLGYQLNNSAIEAELVARTPQFDDLVRRFLASTTGKQLNSQTGEAKLQHKLLREINNVMTSGKVQTVVFAKPSSAGQ